MNVKEFASILFWIKNDIENNFSSDFTVEPTEMETWQHLGILYMRVPFSRDGKVERNRTYKFETEGTD
jgi:hypothetical protein